MEGKIEIIENISITFAQWSEGCDPLVPPNILPYLKQHYNYQFDELQTFLDDDHLELFFSLRTTLKHVHAHTTR